MFVLRSFTKASAKNISDFYKTREFYYSVLDSYNCKTPNILLSVFFCFILKFSALSFSLFYISKAFTCTCVCIHTCSQFLSSNPANAFLSSPLRQKYSIHHGSSCILNKHVSTFLYIPDHSLFLQEVFMVSYEQF